MDAITRISYYFPTHTLCIFQIISNLIINDSGHCSKDDRSLVEAVLVLFSIACFVVSFTDTYSASNGQKFWVLLMPGYGPVCFSLPTDYDKDRVYDFFYIKIRDYVHAVVATACFILIAIFTNPVCMCLFPSGLKDGTSRFDASIVRTVPIVVSILCGMLMICLGPPRQMLGYQNIPDTIPPAPRTAENPMYGDRTGSMREPSVIEEGYEEDGYSDGGPRVSAGKGADYDQRSAPPSGGRSPGPRGGDNYAPRGGDNYAPRSGDYGRQSSSRRSPPPPDYD